MTKYLPILLFFLSYALTGQNGYKDGYYVNLNNDTIKGKIYNSAFVIGSKKYKIKFVDSSGVKITLESDQIKAYGTLDYYIFRAIPVGFKKQNILAEVLIDGDIVLYYFVTDNYPYDPKNYYIQKKTNDSTIKEITVKNFKNAIIPFINDNPGLEKMINENQLRFDDLKLIIKKYNVDKSKSK